MSIHTRVIQAEPDWLLICFEGLKPPVDRRAFFLHRTLSDWLKDHPTRMVAQTVAVQRDGVIVGLNVWLESLPAGETLQAPSWPGTDEAKTAESKTRLPGMLAADGKYPVKVDHDIVESVHHEHLEALIDHAYGILFKDERDSPALAVINRGGLAVVFDRATKESHVMRVEKLGLPAAAAEDLHRWQTTAETSYFVVHLSSLPRAK